MCLLLLLGSEKHEHFVETKISSQRAHSGYNDKLFLWRTKTKLATFSAIESSHRGIICQNHAISVQNVAT